MTEFDSRPAPLSGTTFSSIDIALAGPDDIRAWSHGEVTKPETINYRTLSPERDGLFDERIFGPTKDWECRCGKYKRARFKGVVCEKCGVEVTRSKVRRERMGHIELAAPVTHIWYFKGIPSQMGHVLGMAPKDLERVIYFGAYVVTSVDVEQRDEDMASLEAEIAVERTHAEQRRDSALAARQEEFENLLAEAEAAGEAVPTSERNRLDKDLTRIRSRFDAEADRLTDALAALRSLKPGDIVEDEILYGELRLRFGEYFTGGMGAEAILALLDALDLDTEVEALKELAATAKGAKKANAVKRLKVVSAFHASQSNPTHMVLTAIPVIPPDLRPMVQLDGGRFATSDLNDLYRRVINRNNRLKRLLDLGAPDIIVNNEKRMLQEAVDALFDNGRRGRPVTGPNNRPLKSLSDMLKGKQGRFRQNLLGKRVDYSGRSVIVVGPQLKLHQCGLPKGMALELFKPFVMQRLVATDRAQNIKSAKRMVERGRSVVWDVLEEVIQGQAVLLNRAPTLHRLGIQAFEPQLVEGKAIQLHPLVCTAFNADFDGDQMAVHLPLSSEAQAEARLLMLSANNILSPASGKPITAPTQDMIIGVYYLTGEAGEKERIFSSVSEAIMARDEKNIDIRDVVTIRLTTTPTLGEAPEGWTPGSPLRLKTTLGRCIFNEALPEDYPFVNHVVGKKELNSIIADLVEHYPTHVVAQTLDALKDLGFHWATRSGVSIGINDVVTPPGKADILERHETEAARVERQYERGVITGDERRQELIEIWTEATAEVSTAMEKNFPATNPVFMMIDSGARGNMMQVRQLAGMRGLVANPRGEIIPRPIKSNYREGLSVLEYFIATHGARKGLADTALRTADSGYLTRRLVDVSQDVIVRTEDCGTDRGLAYPLSVETVAGRAKNPYLDASLVSRLLAEDVEVEGETFGRNTPLTLSTLDRLYTAGLDTVRVRSILTCAAPVGACAHCYGLSLATSAVVEVGEAVGIVAAQSIGEPGTQLTMRTFHTGGVAGEDITQGLPRVVELFEARTPKGVAPISEVEGVVSYEDTARLRKITVTPDDGSTPVTYSVPLRSTMLVAEGDRIETGAQLVAGAVDPHEVLRILGPRAVQNHLVDEVQKVYRSQGVSIHDKHIEVIVRQMLLRVTVLDSGETNLLPGSLVLRATFEAENRRAVQEGRSPAAARPVLMGITKASLATESWLSAASFQETTRILTQAAVAGRSDSLEGLKENVIIGNLIPAGTGLRRYLDQEVAPTEAAAQSFWAVAPRPDLYAEAEDEEYEEIGFEAPRGEAVPLDDVTDFDGPSSW